MKSKVHCAAVEEFASELMLERRYRPNKFSTGINFLSAKSWDLTNWRWYNSCVCDDAEDAADPDVLTITEVIAEDFELSCTIGDYIKLVS